MRIMKLFKRSNDHSKFADTSALQMKRVFRGNGLRDCEKKSIWANGKSLGYEKNRQLPFSVAIKLRDLKIKGQFKLKMFASNIVLSNIVFVRNKFNRKVSFQPRKFIFRRRESQRNFRSPETCTPREFGSNSLNRSS